MGLFDLFLKTAETLLPTALDWLDGNSTSSESVDDTNVDEMIDELKEAMFLIL